MEPFLRLWNLVLYRRLATSVILVLGVATVWSAAQEEAPEIARHETPKAKKKDAGPRALALLEIASSGRGTAFPIAILVDGKFYDASAYKATPSPMALEPGTLYEGMRVGRPQGLFTISSVLHSDAINAKYRWLGKGSWLPEGDRVAKTPHKAETTPLGMENRDEPPRLSKAPATPAAGTASADASPKPPASPGESKPASKSTENSSSAVGTSAEGPRLRRGKPTQPLPEDKEEPHGVLQSMLAISDAEEREPVSFQYAWDKSERDAREKQIESLAQDALRAYSQVHVKPGGSPPNPAVNLPSRKRAHSKPETVPLDKVSLVACDVWRGNQPVLIYSAQADLSGPHDANQRPDESTSTLYFLTVVARSDIYGNLKQLFAEVTDQQHLDVAPRLEFVDAVDVDGDGRGELVFREFADSATGYVIYKPGADSLWKMFDSLNLQ